jgi:peptidoglycan/xylan/chitin deacetylase (PgdA/CDA1 family)
MTLVIATYHAIDAGPSPVSTPRDRFVADLDGLQAAGFSFVTLDACAGWLAGDASLPSRSVAITFDDGDASVAEVALPMLAERRVPAAVFVVNGRLGQDNQWPGQWRSVPRRRLIDRDELKALVGAGWTIGAHTWSHPVLDVLDDEGARREVVEAANLLEAEIGRPVRFFAYPYGVAGPREGRLARERFSLAFTAEPRLAAPGTPREAVPRLDASDVGVGLRLGILGSPLAGAYLSARRLARTARRRLRAG